MERALKEAFTYGYQWIGAGQPASYIPQLAKKEKELLSVCITGVDGKTHETGDSNAVFTIQSISKVISLITALKHLSFDEVFSHVGMEPTGDPFNSIIRLEAGSLKPSNPLINAGAIAVVATLKKHKQDEAFPLILAEARALLGDPTVDYDHDVYQSEVATGDKNRALGYMLKSNGIIEGNLEEVLSAYFQACSLNSTCAQLSYFGAILANNGVCPKTNKELIKPEIVKSVVSLMSSCGMYDASGEYALKVGIPSKSGVGGGILACVPGKMGIGVFSPALDAKGNSLCGIKSIEHLSKSLNLSIF